MGKRVVRTKEEAETRLATDYTPPIAGVFFYQLSRSSQQVQVFDVIILSTAFGAQHIPEMFRRNVEVNAGPVMLTADNCECDVHFSSQRWHVFSAHPITFAILEYDQPA
jgi:hypothetical protein